MKNPLSIDSVRRCRACPALGVEHVPSSGNPEARLMIIGQNPGKQEVERGVPFFDHAPSGEALGYFLEELGLDRDEVYIANAVKCGTSGNRRPYPEELATCFQEWLFGEIKLVNPDVILLLGRATFDSVVQGRKTFKHNTTFKNKRHTFVVSWHPSYCIRTDNLVSFVNDVSTTVAQALLDTEDQDG